MITLDLILTLKLWNSTLLFDIHFHYTLTLILKVRANIISGTNFIITLIFQMNGECSFICKEMSKLILDDLYMPYREPTKKLYIISAPNGFSCSNNGVKIIFKI